MRKVIIFVFCFVGTLCVPNVVIDKIEISKVPSKYHLDIANLRQWEETINKSIPEKPKLLSGTEAIINDFADQIFANVRLLMVENSMDPLEMPEVHESFKYTLIIVYHGELDMTNGWLKDISTIHRGGDVILSYSTTDKYLELTVPIAFNDLQFTYDYSAKLMGLGPVGYVDGKVTDLNVEVKLGFNVETLQFSLDEFQVIHAGNIDIAFHGDALIDWLLDVLAFVATTALKDIVVGIVQGIVQGSLESAVDAINDAIDGFLNPTTPVPSTTPVALFLR